MSSISFGSSGPALEGAPSPPGAPTPSAPPARLRIVHVVRAPIGGIFRHIVDLADAQAAAGHEVGIICDSSTGGPFEDDIIAKAATRLALGATRFPMRRQVSLADFATIRRVLAHLTALRPDVLHCHGAKGGVYGRLIATWLGRRRPRSPRQPIARIYAPHGGTLHFDTDSIEGQIYFRVERLFERMTDALVHVSAFEAETYRRKIGIPRCHAAVILNGLRQEEFAPLVPRTDARDLLFLGMLRDLKGTDIFLEAIATVEQRYRRKLTAHIVGQAEEPERYRALARDLGIAERIAFSDPMPARQAFASARTIVVPSRAESMPYVVLEAMAAGMPIIATRVGGIPEIFGPAADELVAPGDAGALAEAIENLFAHPDRIAAGAAARRDWLKTRFQIEVMQGRIEALYREILAEK
jgi:glycosyltransferase involved in cell wall biosynthesis